MVRFFLTLVYLFGFFTTKAFGAPQTDYSSISPKTIEKIVESIESEFATRTASQLYSLNSFARGLTNFYNRTFWNSLPDESVVYTNQFPDGSPEIAERFTLIKKHGGLECMATLPTSRSSHSKIFFDDRFNCISPKIRMDGWGRLVVLDELATDTLRTLEDIASDSKKLLTFLALTFGNGEALIIDKYLNYKMAIHNDYGGLQKISLVIDTYTHGQNPKEKSPFNPDGESHFRIQLRLGECGPTKDISLLYLHPSDADEYHKGNTSTLQACKMIVGTLGEFGEYHIIDFFDKLNRSMELELYKKK